MLRSVSPLKTVFTVVANWGLLGWARDSVDSRTVFVTFDPKTRRAADLASN
jgi:hypothetical protein